MPDREPNFRPDYGIEGPYNGGPFVFVDAIVTRAKRLARWLARIAIVSAAVYAMFVTTGALLRHFGLI